MDYFGLLSATAEYQQSTDLVAKFFFIMKLNFISAISQNLTPWLIWHVTNFQTKNGEDFPIFFYKWLKADIFLHWESNQI